MAALLDVPQYAAANAQVSSLFARLIDPFLRRQILDAPDIATTATLLEQTDYVAENTSQAAELNLAAIERQLRSRLARLSLVPARLISGKAHDLLIWHWRRFELDNLKTVLRMVHYQAPGATIEPAMLDLIAPAGSQWKMLAESGSIAALADHLPDGPNKRVLLQALPRYQRERSLFVLEVSLDLAHGKRMYEFIDTLRGRDRQDAEASLGFQLDVQNLLWAYRYRIYAQLAPEEILNYTIHHRRRVSVDVIRKIALGAPLAEMAQMLWGDRLPSVAALLNLPERQALAHLELDSQRYLIEQARRMRGGYPLHLGRLLAYLILIEAEIQDLIAIFEGHAIGWPAERIRKYLIGSWE
jgi:V/A-type H+-transporting ATPase subunit C